MVGIGKGMHGEVRLGSYISTSIILTKDHGVRELSTFVSVVYSKQI